MQNRKLLQLLSADITKKDPLVLVWVCIAAVII